MTNRNLLGAKDNIVSALGKEHLFLPQRDRHTPAVLNKQIHMKWFLQLPLNNDKVYKAAFSEIHFVVIKMLLHKNLFKRNIKISDNYWECCRIFFSRELITKMVW